MIPYKIIFNTCEDMSYIGKGKAKLVVTSPPYWNLKDYESDNQIGYKENYATYLSRMMQVWEECAKCLHDDGVFIINDPSEFISLAQPLPSGYSTSFPKVVSFDV